MESTHGSYKLTHCKNRKAKKVTTANDVSVCTSFATGQSPIKRKQDKYHAQDSADGNLAGCCSLRALYGTDGTKNATHGSDSPASAAREIRFFFPHLSQVEAKL